MYNLPVRYRGVDASQPHCSRRPVAFVVCYLAVLGATALRGGPAAHGATVTWTNAAGGNWSTGANWSTGLAPAVGDDVVINLAATYTVLLDVDASLSTLTLGGPAGTQTLSLNSGNTLTLTSGLSTVNSQGFLSGIGDLVLASAASMNWTGGTWSGLGSTTLASGASLNISGSANKTLNRNLTNAGTVTWSGTGDLTGGSSNTINNQSGGVFDAQNDQFLQIGVFTNSGSFKKSAGAATTIFPASTQFTNTNTGLVLVQSGSLSFTSALSVFNCSGGTLNIPSGSLTLSGGFNNSGNSSVVAGTLNLAFGLAGSSSGSLSLAAGVVLNHLGGTHQLNAGMTITGTGVYRLNGGTLSNSGAVSLQNLDFLTGTLSSASGSADILTVTGALNWSGGTILGPTSSGSVNISPGATLSISGGSNKTISRNIINSGTTTWTGTGSLLGGGSHTFANEATGFFNVQTTSTLVVGTLTNAGALNLGASPGTVNITGNFSNTGTLNVELGGLLGGSQYDVLNVSGTATLGGALNIALINGFFPTLGDSFQVINYGSRSGSFPTVNGQSIGSNLFLNTVYNPANLTLVTSNLDKSDLMVRNQGEVAYVTDGVYETIPSTQVKSQAVNPGSTATYELNLQNDGNQTSSHVLTGTGSGSGFTVQYFTGLTGGTNITAAVTGAGQGFSLSTGASTNVRIEVTPNANPNSPSGGSSYPVTATLTAGGTSDSVRATTTVNNSDQGDLMIRNNGEVAYLTNDTYEATPITQIKSQSANPGSSATYEIRLQNDGNNTQNYAVTGGGSSSGFTVQYFDSLTGGTNVTSSVTGAGYTVGLTAGEARDLRLVVTPNAIPSSPASGTTLNTQVNITGGSTDSVRASTTVNPTDQADNMIRNQGEVIFATDGAYETTPALQIKNQTVAPGTGATYEFRVQNDGNRTQNYSITGAGSGGGFTVQYFDALVGGTNVTTSVTGSGLPYSLTAGQTQDLRVVVTPNAVPNSPASGSSKSVNITLTGGTSTDVVQANTTVSAADQADNMIRINGESAYLTNDLYEASPSAQIRSLTVNPGVAAVYELQLQNDGNTANSYTLTGTAGSGGFTVQYFDALSGGNNITALVTGGGATFSLASGGTQSVRLVVTPSAIPNSPASGSSLAVNATLTGGGTTDVVRATTAVAASGQADLMVRNTGEFTVDYRYDNTYEATPSTQLKSQTAAPGATATYEVLLQNDGNAAQNLAVTGTGTGGGYTVQYFDAFSGGNNLTAAVTGSGNVFNLAAGGSQPIRITVTPNAIPNAPVSGSSRVVTLTATPSSGGADSIQATTSVSSQDTSDLMIRNKGDVAYLTNNLYENTPVIQVKSQSASPGSPVTYEVLAENDGNNTINYTLTGTPSANSFTVKYYNAFNGGTEITSGVTGSGQTFSLAAGTSQQVRVEVTPNAIPNSPAGGSSYPVTMVFSDGTSTDTVRATTTANNVDQGDSMIRNSGETTYLTDNVYEATPSAQIKSQSVNPGSGATYEIKLQNDGNRTQTYTVTGTASSAGFAVQYFDSLTGGTDVSSSVTGAGLTYSLAAGASQDVRLVVTPTALPNSPTAGTTKTVNVTFTGGGTTDVVRANTTVNAVDRADNMIRNQGEVTFLTNDGYEATPALQVKNQSVAPGANATYEFRVQNDGNRTQSYTIGGTAGSGGFTVQYLDALSGGNDVTGAITGGGLTYSLNVGETRDLRLVVSPGAMPNSPAAGTTLPVSITLTGGGTTDAVRANTTVTTVDQADNMIRVNGETAYLTNDLYETTPSTQVKNLTVNPGATAVFEVQLQNDGNRTNNYTLTAPAGSGGFTVQYFDALSGGNNITSLVTGSGASFSLTAGATQPIRAVVTPNAIPGSPTAGSSQTLNMTLSGGGTTDVVRALTTVATAGQADMMIRSQGEFDVDYRFNNLYETTPTTQFKTQTVAPGATATYEALLQNDGNQPQNITVTGTGTGSGFTVQYFDALSGGNNITAAVTGSGNVFSLLPGSTQAIRIQVTPDAAPNAPSGGSSRVVTLMATPASGGADTVQATTTVTTKDSSDLMIRNKGEIAYLSDNLYENTPVIQVKSQSASPGAPVTYEVLVQNDGNSTLNYTLTGTNSTTSFAVKYFNAFTGGTDITSGVTGSGQTFSLASGATQPVRLEVAPAALPNAPAGGTTFPVTLTLTDGTSMDTVRATTTATTGDRADIMIRKNGETAYLTNDVYESIPSVQVKSQSVLPGGSVTYEFMIQNDGNRSQTYTLTGTTNSTGFTVQYFDSLVGGSDITSSVTGGGLAVPLIAGEAREYHVVVTPDPFPNSPLSGARKPVTITLTGGGTSDSVLADTEVGILDQIDAMIRNQGEADADYRLNNTYEASPVSQVKAQTTVPGTKVTYEIKLENEGDRAFDYVVSGTGDSEGWTVRYFDALSGGNDVTAEVAAGTKVFPIPVNASRLMRVEVTPSSGASSPVGGSTKDVTVTVTGGTGGKDSVRASTTVSSLDQADLMVRDFGQTVFVGDNIYETGTPAVQVLSQTAKSGTRAIYELRIQNDGNRSQDFTLTGTGSSAGFDVKYFDALTGGTDITSLTIGTGKSFNLSAGAALDLRVEVTPNAVPGSPAAGTTKDVTLTIAGGGSVDRALVTTTAAATDQADARIKNPQDADADYRTNDLYEVTPSAQVKSQTVNPGVTGTYYMALQNDGNRTQTYTMIGTGNSSGWTVRYFDAQTGGTEITSAVTGPGVSFALAVASEQALRVEVTPASVPTSPPASTIKDVIATFFVPDVNNQPTAVDSVKASTTVNNEDKSDLMIRNKGESTYLTDNLYENPPAVQSKSQSVALGQTAVYELQLQNDGNRTHEYKLIGSGGDSNWTAAYFDELNFGNDITSSVTGIGKAYSLAAGETREVRLEVSPKAVPNAPASGSSHPVTVSFIGSTVDTVKATTTIGDFDRADAMIRNSGETAFVSDNVYEATPASQVKAQTAVPGSGANYEIRLQNDGNRTQSYTVTGTGSSTGFTVHYFDNFTGGNDLTTGITGAGLTYSLVPGETRNIRLVVTPGAVPNSPIYGAVKGVVVSVAGGGTTDSVQADTTVGPFDQLDLMIRNQGEATFVTDNLYESVPVTQKKAQSVAPGVGALYEIRIQNDGNRSIDTVYTGSAAVSGFTVQYFDSLAGGTEITGLVTGDGAPIKLAVGQSMDMRVVVTPNAMPNAPAAGSTQIIALTWSGSGTSKDVVRSETTVAALDQADLMVRNHDQTTYLADNVYEASPVLQVKAQSVAGGLKAIYEMKAENDGNRPLDYVVTGTGTSSGFDVKYFDALSGGTDITSLVTGAGKAFNLAPSASKEFRVEVTPNADPNSPAVGTTKEVTVALTGGGAIDSVKTTTTVNSTDQGDLMIRNPSEVDADYATNNAYEISPSTQVRTQTVDPGTPATYLMKLQNDGNRTQTYTVIGTGDSTGWSAQYFSAHTGGTNITASVTGTGRQFILPVGGEQLLRVEVTPSAIPSSPPAAATKDVTVTCLVPDANNQPIAVDSVKATTVVNGGDKPDLMIRSKGESTYLSDNVYETAPVLQVKSQSVSVSGTVTYELRLQNDGNRSHDYKVLGTGGDSNWMVKYFDEQLFGNDITSSVTTSGKTFTLASGQATEVRFEVTANPFPNAPAAGSSKEAIVYLVGSSVDTVKATTTVTSGSQADLMIRNSGETSYQGDNTFETLPTVQVREQTINPGGSAKYEVRLQNDGNTTRTFLLKAGEAGDAGWSATYKAGITNVTSQITGASGYTTASLAPGGQITLTVEVIPDVTALAGSARTVTLKAYLDASDTTIRDAVSTVTTVTAGLTLTSPNGGEKWQRGTMHEITWLSSGNPGSDVKLDLYRSAGSGSLVFDSTIVATTPNNGSYEWTLPATQSPGELYRVKVSSVSDSGVGDGSDADFQVLRAAPTVTSITPSTGNNTETINVVIAGTGFVGGGTAKLSKAGTDLGLTDVVVDTEGSQITATLDLTNAGAGEYDVVVVNADGQSGKLLHGFTVTAGVSITLGNASGYSLISLPFVQDGYDPVATGLIDNNRNAALARWNPRKASDPTYSNYEFLVGGGLILPPSIRFTTVENGIGYWRKSSATLTGTFTSRTTPWEVPVYVGSGAFPHWNLIGVPFTGTIDFSSLQVLANGKTYSITDATALGIVGNFAWKYPSASGYRLVALPNTYDGAETTLDPGLGYWFYANQDCYLRFLPPSGTAVRATKVHSSFRSSDPNQWAVQIKARAGQYNDEYNYFGTASATRSLADPPQAPDSGYISLSFNGSGDTASRTRDLGANQAVSQASGQLSWEFQVATNLSEPVEISWPDLSPAPRQFALYLQDLETGRRLYMNTQSIYRFQPHGSGTPYRFRINAELRGADRLLIQGLNVLPAGRLTRSGNMVSFALTQEADVQVRILGASGRVVSQLRLPTARRGLNSAQVPLTNDLGFVLPRGFYLCEVTATTAEGRVVKAVRGFSLR